jgi:hypothetical protein
VGAAGCAVLAPLLLGLFQATPLGWRAALALPPGPPAPPAPRQPPPLTLTEFGALTAVACTLAAVLFNRIRRV